MVIEYEVVNELAKQGAPAKCYGACCVHLNAGGPKTTSNSGV